MADEQQKQETQDFDFTQYISKGEQHLIISLAAYLSGKPAEDLDVKQAMQFLSNTKQDPAAVEKALDFDLSEEDRQQLQNNINNFIYPRAVTDILRQYGVLRPEALETPLQQEELKEPAHKVNQFYEEGNPQDADLLAFNEALTGSIAALNTAFKSMGEAATPAYQTEFLQHFSKMVTFLAANAEILNSVYTKAQDLEPYIIEELKKPEYEGYTLYQLALLPSVDEDGEPTRYGLLVQQALAAAEEARAKDKKPRRTKSKAGEIVGLLPKTIAFPTYSNYEFATSLYPKGNAHLEMLSRTENLVFKDGKLFFKGAIQPISEVELQKIKTNEGIENIDLPLLRTFYSIILSEFEKTNYKETKPELTMYLPDLAEYLGTHRNLNKQEIDTIIAKTQSFQNIIGILHTSEYRRSIYAVLIFHKYDAEKNTITFSSPYMNMVIQRVFDVAIRKDKNQNPIHKKNGEPMRLPTHSYNLVKGEIAKERNKAAAENVFIICTVIEKAGNNTPNIKAKTLIERNPQLQKRLVSSKNPGQLLKTCFKKTWELLQDKTFLQEVYKNIKLPDPNNPAYIPTVKNLETLVFEFPHEGKTKGTEDPHQAPAKQPKK